jgi:DNA repair protein RadC
MVVREAITRYRRIGVTDAERVDHPDAAAAAMRFAVGDDPRECFCVMYLDSRHKRIDVEVISIGTLNQSLVHPREVFRGAIRRNAQAIVIAHNHPSGDPAPSREDIEVTEKLIKAGEIIGIRILDHIVVGADAHTSIYTTHSHLWRRP